MFKAVLIDRDNDGKQTVSFTELDENRLPEYPVTVRVEYSTLNYKDALAITHKAPIVKQYPLVPGVDIAGVVEASSDPDYKPGDRVVLNGWGVGESYWGGLAQKARLKGEWLIPLPDRFTTRQAMAIGTAGYTAMLCILALERHGVTPDKGEILVTGAAGGVGSVAVALLAKLGYRTVAVTGRAEEADYLTALGAAEILPREQFSRPGRPLGKERWAGAVDVVGGHTLANVCATMRYNGVVAACGLAGGMDLPATVAPFILRGVTLAGVDSVQRPRSERLEAWRRLAQDLDPQKLASMTYEIGLSEAVATAPHFMEGKIRGRIVVDTSR